MEPGPQNTAASDLADNVKRARFARAEHRARQHADGHADAGAHHAIVEHPDVPRGDANVATTPAQLNELLAHLREAAGAHPGDIVSLEIAPVAEEPEPKVPADLRKALADAHPKARA